MKKVRITRMRNIKGEEARERGWGQNETRVRTMYVGNPNLRNNDGRDLYSRWKEGAAAAAIDS